MIAVDAIGRIENRVDALGSAIREEPLLAAAVAIGVVLLLAAAWLLVRYLRRTPGERFARLVWSQDAIAVLMHPAPDPDAMSSALAVETLAQERDTDATIYYSEDIRRHENRAFQTVLDATFEQVDSAAAIDEQEVVLVDHNQPRGFDGAETIQPLAVVDHHPGDGTGEEFTDVRSDLGACATICSEYFDSLGWVPVTAEELEQRDSTAETLGPRISTALLYGIQSDTNHLTNGCTAAEFEAAGYLYQGIDEDNLDRIANPDIDAESLDIKARAITDREIRSAFAVSEVGEVSNTDAVPQAAEELRRLEGVTAVVVLGEKNGVLHLSGRSEDDRVHMGNTLRAAVEDVLNGPLEDEHTASAGGHARMGGGQLSVEHLDGLDSGDGTDREAFTDRLFAAMNGEL